MRKLAFIFGVALLSSAILPAADPVGSVTSAHSFMLRGHNVPVDGIPHWPLMTGDAIATSSSPAIIQFQDGSRLLLAENSRGKVEQSNGSTVFRLQSGSAVINSSQSPNRVSFLVGNNPVAALAGVNTPVTTATTTSSSNTSAVTTQVTVPKPTTPVATVLGNTASVSSAKTQVTGGSAITTLNGNSNTIAPITASAPTSGLPTLVAKNGLPVFVYPTTTSASTATTAATTASVATPVTPSLAAPIVSKPPAVGTAPSSAPVNSSVNTSLVGCCAAKPVRPLSGR